MGIHQHIHYIFSLNLLTHKQNEVGLFLLSSQGHAVCLFHLCLETKLTVSCCAKQTVSEIS